MPRQYRFNDPSVKARRQELRNNMPKAEVILWSQLKGKQFLKHKFRRQYGIGPFIIDFYCPKLKLAIELDGASHRQKGAEEYDKERQAYIERFGIQFLRFPNEAVYEGLNGVMQTIGAKVDQLSQSA